METPDNMPVASAQAAFAPQGPVLPVAATGSFAPASAVPGHQTQLTGPTRVVAMHGGTT